MKKSIESPNQLLVSDRDTKTIKRLEAMLQKCQPKLVGTDGEEMPLPKSVYKMLQEVTHLMAEGKTISLISHKNYLSCNEAADLLDISRPSLYALLDQRQISFIKVGTHRRLLLEDVIAYKKYRDAQHRYSIDDLAISS